MNTKKKGCLRGCLLASAFVLAGLVLFIGASVIGVLVAKQKYDKCDHGALLLACRQMFANQNSYTNSPNLLLPTISFGPGRSFPEGIWLHSKGHAFGADIPEAIRKLNPKYIIIREDYIMLDDPPPLLPMRRGVIAFAPDAKLQFGTQCYLNGLWFWNGDFQSNEMKNRVYGRKPETKGGQ